MTIKCVNIRTHVLSFSTTATFGMLHFLHCNIMYDNNSNSIQKHNNYKNQYL